MSIPIERQKRRFNILATHSYRLLLVVMMGAGLFWLDSRYPTVVEPVHHYGQQVIEPFIRLLSYPQRIMIAIQQELRSPQDLQQENKLLSRVITQQAVELQQLAELKAENNRLRALINMQARLDENLVNAEVISSAVQLEQQVLMINKGLREGLQVGYPVLDAQGIMGRIVESSSRLAKVMLLTDSRHAIPVRVKRTQEHAILKGTGDHSRLRLEYAPDSMDVKQGDVLESSGMGQYYPAGYPVAVVTDVQKIGGTHFANVTAQALADINHSKQVIVLFKQAPMIDDAPKIEALLPKNTSDVP
ncbi:MAG: rod shape-determining protein MreC [Agitococcus sp.]